jgi:cadmium resistance protein CadD (predicted permease)
MSKLLLYYSFLWSFLVTVVALFSTEEDMFLGGLSFLPVVYILWEVLNEQRAKEKEAKKKELETMEYLVGEVKRLKEEKE